MFGPKSKVPQLLRWLIAVGVATAFGGSILLFALALRAVGPFWGVMFVLAPFAALIVWMIKDLLFGQKHIPW